MVSILLLILAVLMFMLCLLLREDIFDDREKSKVFVKKFGYILISPDIKEHKEIVDKIRSITIAKSISFIIKNIIVSILILVILIGGIMYFGTRETKQEIFEKQYTLVENQDGGMINIINNSNEYILTTIVKESNGKSVLKKISLGYSGDIENIEFISNDNNEPKLEIIEKISYETNIFNSFFDKDYREKEKTGYKYIFTMPSDDMVKILNEVNSLKSR